MEVYFPLKMKRKDLDDVNDKFSDFSLRACARKIRRLDVGLPPIVEEEEFDISMMFKQSVPRKRSNLGGLEIDESPSEDEKKAIVLFKDQTNQVTCLSQSNSWRLDNENAESNDTDSSNKGCLAVVPWIPPPLPSTHTADLPSQNDTSDMMDTEETEEATIDVGDGMGVDLMNANEAGAAGLSHQWRQQYCKIPQLPHLSTTPISWHR
ncbi:uncharacterized protein LOC142551897 isoform X2 [Primulina tabacum]|uniref:uncharacterized protein LOC142551897 isoform X2 n=1 Tax=Primulina tabacum TaxID=48773 RepID=UPI003F5A56BE